MKLLFLIIALPFILSLKTANQTCEKSYCIVKTCFKFKNDKPIESWFVADINDDISGSGSCVDFEYTGGNYFIFVYFSSSNPGGVLYLRDLATSNLINTYSVPPSTTSYTIVITNPCINDWLVEYY